MQSILKSCKPRADLLAGSFNPEVFTASLRQVIGHYRGDVKVATPRDRRSAARRDVPVWVSAVR